MAKKTIIVSIHGILTDIRKTDDWQEVFGNWIKENYLEEMSEKTLGYKVFSFGYLTPVKSWIRRWLIPLLEKLKLDHLSDNWAINRFEKYLLKLKKANPGARIHVVGHSYGTWVTVRMLRRNCKLHVQSITLIGSVVSAHVKTNGIIKLLTNKQIRACYSYSSHNDTVVRMSPPPFGHLGYWGFLTNDDEDRINPKLRPFPGLAIYNNHSKDYDHNDYFNPGVFATILEGIEDANKR